MNSTGSLTSLRPVLLPHHLEARLLYTWTSSSLEPVALRMYLHPRLEAGFVIVDRVMSYPMLDAAGAVMGWLMRSVLWVGPIRLGQYGALYSWAGLVFRRCHLGRSLHHLERIASGPTLTPQTVWCSYQVVMLRVWYPRLEAVILLRSPSLSHVLARYVLLQLGSVSS